MRAHEVRVVRSAVSFLEVGERDLRLHEAIRVALDSGEQDVEFAIVDATDIQDDVRKLHRQRQPKGLIDVAHRPAAPGGLVLAGEQGDRTHSPSLQDLQLLPQPREIGRVALDRVVVAAHAAHAALGVARVGHVERGEGFQAPRVTRARFRGQLVDGVGVQLFRKPQDGHVLGIESVAAARDAR